jgi:hypothetical protein
MACGGGGGPSTNSTNVTSVTFSTKTATASFVQNQKQYVTSQSPDPIVSITATFSSLPTGTIYPVIAESTGVFVTGSNAVIQNSSTTFTTTLKPDVTRAPGVYQGTLTLLLCKDPACSAQYQLSGGTLPFVVTITPELNVSVKINGVLQAQVMTPGMPGSYTVIAGQTFELDSNMPISVGYSSGLGMPVVTPSVTNTSTLWQATVSTGAYGNSLGFVVMPADNSQYGVGFTLIVTP